MGNIFRLKTQPEISRIINQQFMPLIDEQIQFKRRNPENQVTIGKNVFLKRLTEHYSIQKNTRQLLGRYYIRIMKQNERIKIGIQGNTFAQENFVRTFLNSLVESHMSGYVFVCIELPLLKELAKVDYSNLRRLEIVKCNIENIEPISWIISDKFQTIYLRSNNITNIHSLAKTRFPNFLSIQLDDNFINSFKPLTRTMMTVYNPQKKNKFFLFTNFQAQYDSDLSFIVKTQNTLFCLVGERDKYSHLIKNDKVFAAIQRLQAPAQL